jgi:O-methyltransferase
MLKRAVKNGVRVVTAPFLRQKSIAEWPAWLGQIHGVKVIKSIVPQEQPAPTGEANLNILISLIERTRELPGEIADVGAYRGEATLAMALYLRERGIKKTVYGFDSFEGFKKESVVEDLKISGIAADIGWRVRRFKGTSLAEVSDKVSRLKLANVKFVPGYFSESFPAFPKDIQFSFTHIDVNLYSSYKEALEFFFPRTVPGGVILFDEYNDPPWPGCNKAVDEFLTGKPEQLQEINLDNYQKWYVVKN